MSLKACYLHNDKFSPSLWEGAGGGSREVTESVKRFLPWH